jgi:hypothetical protein
LAKPTLSRSLAAAAALAFAVALWLLPPASAADPGQMESMELRATPAAQGVGGPFEVTLTVEFATDPHATLAVTNLTAHLSVPDGLTLIAGQNPVHEARIDLPPTQSYLVKTYAWTLRGDVLGNYTLNVTLTTDAAGGGGDEVGVLVREGIVIGQVTATPARPKTSEAMRFEVAVVSGFDAATSPLQVWLYVYQSPSPATPASANGSRLRLTSGQTVLAPGFPMEAGANDTYTYTIDEQPRGTLIYWVFAQTPHSNTTTRPAKALVDDPNVSGPLTIGMLAGVSAAGAAATAYLVWDPASRRPATRGSVHNSPDRVRMGLIVLAAAVAVLAAALLMGALGQLWGRLGYA